MNELKKTKNLSDLRKRLGRSKPSDPGPPDPNRPPPQSSAPPPPGMGPNIAPPPFAPARGYASARKKRDATGPFAATQAAGPQEVRLVVDDRAVSTNEVGIKVRSRVMVAAFATAIIAGGVGWFAGNTSSDRRLWGKVLVDAKAIYEAVQAAEPELAKSQQLAAKAAEAAFTAEGVKPKIDMESLDALVAMKKPIDASIFARRHYRAFQPSTVDQLFEYYNSVGMLWDEFRGIRNYAKTHLSQISESIDAAGEVRSAQYGCLISTANDITTCALGTIRLDKPIDKQLPSSVQFAQRSGAAPGSKSVFKGQSLNSKEEAVVFVDKEHSLGVLGKRASDFARYLDDLRKIDARLKRIMELQGLLLTEFGKIKSLQ